LIFREAAFKISLSHFVALFLQYFQRFETGSSVSTRQPRDKGHG
jgi:hypothetical protein